jgi:hypothetical protein
MWHSGHSPGSVFTYGSIMAKLFIFRRSPEKNLPKCDQTLFIVTFSLHGEYIITAGINTTYDQSSVPIATTRL